MGGVDDDDDDDDGDGDDEDDVLLRLNERGPLR